MSSAVWGHLSLAEAANIQAVNGWRSGLVGARSSVRWGWQRKQEPDTDEVGCFPRVIRMLGGLMNVSERIEIFWE